MTYEIKILRDAVTFEEIMVLKTPDYTISVNADKYRVKAGEFMPTDHRAFLGRAVEELAEAQKIIGKSIRFGLNSDWTGETNEAALVRELGDAAGTIILMIQDWHSALVRDNS